MKKEEKKLSEKNKELEDGLQIVELEERLEMVQLSTPFASGSWRCDNDEAEKAE